MATRKLSSLMYPLGTELSAKTFCDVLSGQYSTKMKGPSLRAVETDRQCHTDEMQQGCPKEISTGAHQRQLSLLRGERVSLWYCNGGAEHWKGEYDWAFASLVGCTAPGLSHVTTTNEMRTKKGVKGGGRVGTPDRRSQETVLPI